MFTVHPNADDINGHWPYVIRKHGKDAYWLRLDGHIAGSHEPVYQAYNVDNLRRPVTLQKSTHWILQGTTFSGIDKYCRPTGSHIDLDTNQPTTGEIYRATADELAAKGRDADADVYRVMAQESDRLDALAQTPAEQFEKIMDELDAVYERDTRPCLDGLPSVKVTKDGVQNMLPGYTPEPVKKGENTQQLTMF